VEYEQRETLLVILGAGASHDCLPEPLGKKTVRVQRLEPLPLADVLPPLTKELADGRPLQNELLAEWPDAGPVIDYLRRGLKATGADGSPATTLERALGEYQDGVERVPERRRHLLTTRFYLRDLLWRCTDYMKSASLTGGITNYLTLGSDVLDWCAGGDRCAVFVDFNYDLLLEDAFSRLWGFDALSMKSYLAHDRITLLKPHGSVQWHWPVLGSERTAYGYDPRLLARKSINAALTATIEQDQLFTLRFPTHDWGYSSQVTLPLLIPAIALPIERKPELIWPKEQQERLSSLQGMVSRVLIVGWRAAEPEFLQLIRPLVRVDAKWLVVTGGDSSRAQREAAEVIENLRSALQLPRMDTITYDKGFRTLLIDEKQSGSLGELGRLLR